MSKKEFTSFSALSKAKLDLPDADKPKKKEKKKPIPVVKPELGNDESALFMRAMSGAQKIEKTTHHKAQKIRKPIPVKAQAKKPEQKKAEPPKAISHRTQPMPQKTKQAPASEEDMFLKAMGGVSRIDGSGRDVAPKASPEKTLDLAQAEHNTLRDLALGDIHFEYENTANFQYGRVKGLDPKIFNKLKAGSTPIDDRLDLHGMFADEAIHATVDFIHRSYKLGKRSLLLVTGQGHNSPQGRSVVREEVFSILMHEPLYGVVLAFVTAQPKDGGSGALYVHLRKYRKSMDKLLKWDASLPETD